VWMI